MFVGCCGFGGGICGACRSVKQKLDDGVETAIKQLDASSPVTVCRGLKSPNWLTDRNWFEKIVVSWSSLESSLGYATSSVPFLTKNLRTDSFSAALFPFLLLPLASFSAVQTAASPPHFRLLVAAQTSPPLAADRETQECFISVGGERRRSLGGGEAAEARRRGCGLGGGEGDERKEEEREKGGGEGGEEGVSAEVLGQKRDK
ncbi:hypothetical protein Droror1_Dr00026137 [Drosera rotundifolia]